MRGEIGISNTKARISRSRLLYLRRIETGNNGVLKRKRGKQQEKQEK